MAVNPEIDRYRREFDEMSQAAGELVHSIPGTGCAHPAAGPQNLPPCLPG